MRSILLSVWLVAPFALAAQNAASAVGTITPADVSRRVHIIAHDSMGGRDTPSPGLDKTAAYIAAEFRRLGLKPGGDSGTYLQRYGVSRQVFDTTAAQLRVGGLRPAALQFGVDYYATGFDGLPPAGASGAVVVLAGPPDSTNPFGGQSIAGAWVILRGEPGRGRSGLTFDLAAMRSAATGGAA